MNKFFSLLPPLLFLTLTLTGYFFMIFTGSTHLLLVLFLFFLSIFALADLINRNKDYIEARHDFQRGVSLKVIAHRHHSSWCQRTAAIGAVTGLDRAMGTAIKNIYKEMGYRWYHFLPKGIFTRDSHLFKPSYYKKLISRIFKK